MTGRRQHRPEHRRGPHHWSSTSAADELHHLTVDPCARSFCEAAYLVDDYAPVTLLGAPGLALRACIPEPLGKLELANRIEDLDCITIEFRTLTDDKGASLWRCDIGWVGANRPIYSLAAILDSDDLSQLRAADLLYPIRAETWERWQFSDAHLVIRNDRRMWEQWSR